MEHALEVLMLAFGALVFALSISLMMLMYNQVDELYSYTKNHENIKNVLESDVLGR